MFLVFVTTLKVKFTETRTQCVLLLIMRHISNVQNEIVLNGSLTILNLLTKCPISTDVASFTKVLYNFRGITRFHNFHSPKRGKTITLLIFDINRTFFHKVNHSLPIRSLPIGYRPSNDQSNAILMLKYL